MSENLASESKSTFSFDEVAFGNAGPVIVQIGVLADLPEQERNAMAWTILQKAARFDKRIKVVE